MYVCVECRYEMRCDKNGVGARYGTAHVYAGDRYICPVCGKMILVTNGRPSHDPDGTQQDEYIEMREKKDLVP